MLGAGHFFVFTHTVKSAGDALTLAVVYKPPGPVIQGAVEDVLKSLSKGPFLPDAVVFLTIAQDVQCDWMAELARPTVEATWLRFKGRSCLKRATICLQTGDVATFTAKEPHGASSWDFADTLKGDLAGVLKSGLLSIFDSPEVVLVAPPGYTYQKPSGKSERFFLKPDVALKNSASVAFVALAVYVKFGARQLHAAEDLRYLYLDTMAIAPVGYSLRDLMHLARGSNTGMVIESFHSYGGIANIGRPLPGTSICLISASTSMAMHAQWVNQMEVPPGEVITLLTVDVEKQFASGALLSLPRPSNGVSEGPPQLSITLVGETFLPSTEPPKKVTLAEKDHAAPEVDVFREFAGEGVFDLWRKPVNQATAKPRPLFVDGEKLVKSNSFSKWLDERLVHSARAVTTRVVYQEDEASHLLAVEIAKRCSATLGLTAVDVLPGNEIDAAEFKDGTGLIICAAVIGKGSQLLEISAALRDKHRRGPRLYLVGLQVTETRGELKALGPNLVHSKTVKHEFEVFNAVAVGRQLGSSYQDEIRKYYPSGASMPSVKWLRDRAAALGTVDALGMLALMPSGAADEALALREGFAYWRNGYTPGPLHAEVMGTVGALLQRAREEVKLPPERRLASSSYQHVVLSPENFARYNDGVIQGALLRNAFPSELDYRTDATSSGFLKALILRQLARAGRPPGEGLLEFLLAISLGRLRLLGEHEDEVLEAVAAAELPAGLRASVDFLLGKGGVHSEGQQEEDVPF